MAVGTELRRDYALRRAIDDIHLYSDSVQFKETSTSAMPKQILLKMAELTLANYCFILSFNESDAGNATYFILQLEEYPVGDAHFYCKSDQKIHAWLKLNIFWSKFIAANLALICNEPLSAEQLAIFPEQINKGFNTAFLPLIEDGSCIGVIALVNRYTPFDEHELHRLQIFLKALHYKKSEVKKVETGNAFFVGMQKDKNSFFFSGQHISDILVTSFDSIIILNEKNEVIAFNAAAEKAFGFLEKDILGRSIDHLIFIPKAEPITMLLRRSLPRLSANDATTWRSVVGRRYNGEQLLMNLSFKTTRCYGHIKTTLILQDVSSVLQATRESSENLLRFKLLANLAPVGIIQVSSSWMCTYANDEWYRLTHSTPDEVLGFAWSHVFSSIDMLENLAAELECNQYFTTEMQIRDILGQSTWVRFNARALYSPNGNMHGFLATMIDINHQRMIESQLRKIAEIDSLTGLTNRASFENQLQTQLSQSSENHCVAVLFIDLDGFKAVNDTLGHDMGDELLKIVAERVRRAVRAEDVVSRFGGDEFTVMLGALPDKFSAAQSATAIIEHIKKPYCLAHKELFITASVGIAMGYGEGSSGLLLKQADIALYHAKNSGRNNFQFFASELDECNRVRIEVTNQLHRALDRKEFKLAYQPVLNIDSAAIVGFEALLRWFPQNQGQNEYLPEEVINILEQSVLILDVGFWVLCEACKQFALWLTAGHIVPMIGHQSTTITVNVSAKQLSDEHFESFVLFALSEAKLAPHYLTLEITETALMENSTQIRDILMRLRSLGIKIALDDFGVGYCSLGYLRDFRVDCLKIDRSFLRSLEKETNRAIMTAIVTMAKSLDILLIAEGVESEQMLTDLKLLGCGFCQGYYISKPLLADQVVSQLAREEHLFVWKTTL